MRTPIVGIGLVLLVGCSAGALWAVAGAMLCLRPALVLGISGGIVGASVAIVVVMEELARDRVRARFRSRTDIPLDAFYEQHYGGSGLPKDVVAEVLQYVAEAYYVSPGQLRPSDRLDVELAPEPGYEWESDLVDILFYIDYLQDKAEETGMQRPEGMRLETLGDLIEHAAWVNGGRA